METQENVVSGSKHIKTIRANGATGWQLTLKRFRLGKPHSVLYLELFCRLKMAVKFFKNCFPPPKGTITFKKLFDNV